jgi:lysophospholipase L1-like esterase
MRLSRVVLSILLAGASLAFVPPANAQPTTAPSVALQPADVAAPKLAKNGKMDAHFQKLHDEFLKRRTEGPIGVVFLGDSITEGWDKHGKALWEKYYAPMNAVNFGISGDQTQHVLWRIDQGELDGINPKVVVLLIGTNNAHSYSAEDILKADTKIIQEIHDKLPETKVLVLGIFPRGFDPKGTDKKDAETATFREKIAEVNKGLAALDDGNKTRFLDFGDKFLDADGKIPKDIMPDSLHPNEKGYQIWVDAMNPLLTEMMK